MDFFGIGLGEVLLILVVALIVWGPKRLPEIARTMGKTIRALRKATYDITSQVTRELDIQEKETKEKDSRLSRRKISATSQRLVRYMTCNVETLNLTAQRGASQE